jgi:hypothetical protein
MSRQALITEGETMNIPKNENESVKEFEQNAEPVAVTAPRLEQVTEAIDDASAADSIEREVQPVEVAQD